MTKTIYFACSALLLISTSAYAGRPLSTDDASTTGHLHYQFEAWKINGQDNHAWTLAPAVCYGEFELGVGRSYTRAAESQKTSDNNLYLKWAPAALTAGPLHFGGKIWTTRNHDNQANNGESRTRENGAFLIASLAASDQFSLHANLGVAHNLIEHRNERIGNLAASWTPHPRVQLFAEALKQQYAPTQQAMGGRWWAIADKLGIDLTTSRLAGRDKSTTIGVGFGWYGSFAN